MAGMILYLLIQKTSNRDWNPAAAARSRSAVGRACPMGEPAGGAARPGHAGRDSQCRSPSAVPLLRPRLKV